MDVDMRLGHTLGRSVEQKKLTSYPQDILRQTTIHDKTSGGAAQVISEWKSILSG